MSTYDTTFEAGLVPAAAVDRSPQPALPLAAIEQYRALARRLDVERAAGGPRAMVVTSPTTAEGRTTTALYTAIALAGRGHRVVLADFDLRRPELAARHDLPELPGLVEVIRGEASLDQALRLAPGAPGLTLLPAGTALGDPAIILFDPRTKTLVDSLNGAFDFVLADAPPALGVADAACLADIIGGALLVARAGRTSRRELAAAAAALRGVKIVGCVLTGVETFASLESKRAEQVIARKPMTTALATRG